MERGIRFRVKEVSLLLIVFVSATIVLWAWEKVPVLTQTLPPRDTSESLLFVMKDIEVTETQKEVAKGSLDLPTTSVEEEETEDTGKKHEILKVDSADNSTSSTDTVEKHENVGKKSLEGKDQIVSLAEQNSYSNSSSVIVQNDQQDVTAEEASCNYAKGKWIVDDNQPLYSGFGCKQWLAPMWACKLMQRKDFAYEKLRWQPLNCELERFTGFKYLERMRGKTLAFVGDSLGRQQFQSLMCMITGGEEWPDVIDVGQEFGLIKPVGSIRPNGWAYRFPAANSTVLYYWSATLCDLEPIDANNPHTDYAMHLDRPPAFLRDYLHKIDVLVLNTGHHWNRGKLRANRWVMHVGGAPNTNRRLAMLGDAKNFTIHSIVKWVDEQLPKHPHLKAFYRSISPRHFVNGDWNTGGSCDNTTPVSVGKEVLQDESSDYSAGRAVEGTRVKLLEITALSQVRDEGHISKFSITASPGIRDCLHWCLPGVPDTWNEILFAQI